MEKSINDEHFVVPAYLSICSFLRSNKIPIVVVVCGEIVPEGIKNLFTSLNELIHVEQFNIPVEYISHPHSGTITNRLARMHYASQSNEDIILLLDADTLFSAQSSLLISTIHQNAKKHNSWISGVLDAQIAYRDYLYFRTQDASGRDVVVPHLEQKDIYASVFGGNWWHHLKGASINNGVVAFYKCNDVIEQWKDFYLRGIKFEKVNPGDDQLPLAAAIHRTSENVICLPEIFNSKGKLVGDFHVYHALSSKWKMQLFSAYKMENDISEYANLAKAYLPQLSNKWKEEFFKDQSNIEPYLFNKIDGHFGYKHLYEDVYRGIDKGIFVEVGMNKGKSACYLLELIKAGEKEVKFIGIEEGLTESQDIDAFLQLVKSFHLDPIELFESHDSIPEPFLDDQVDFVFLNLQNDYDKLKSSLEWWWTKMKPGGIIAGYDYTSQIGLDYGSKCATYDFCKSHNFSLRISFDIFIIEKPKENSESEQEPLEFSQSIEQV
ncbi:MAG: class I SAM-dependent methyltransferase [Saprospiraceae bacterium]|nr:class I SAM-dependent methyltransferase [Saprospiraceae bacterium]